MAEFMTKQFERLRESIQWSEDQLGYPRKRRVGAIKELVGKHYMEGGHDKIMPVNAMKLAVDIYVRHLAARNPQAMFTADDPNLKPTAREFEIAVNQVPAEIGLAQTLRQVVTEAIFSPLGVVKCGLDATNRPFVDCITLDNYFCDLSAKTWEQVQYEGNSYWMDYEDFQKQEWNSTKDIKFDHYEVTGPGGESQADSVTATSTANVFRERIWLRDVWLPKERLLLTYGVKSDKLFNVVEWDEDVPPPYYRLGFTHVPGNLLPLPPIAVWRDLNELSNAVFRKLGFSADSYKSCLGFPGGNEDGVTAFKNAKHGDGFATKGAQKPEEWTAGGIDPKALAFWLQLKELQSYYGGNYDSLGGLAPATQTIGQDKLLAEAAGAQLRDMADQTIDFVKTIFKSLAYYEWTNTESTRYLMKPSQGSVPVPFVWDQAARRGRFKDFQIDIDVYSMQDDSPMLRLQKLGAFMQQYIFPAMPFIQQEGGSIDWEGFIKEAAHLANMDWIGEFVKFPEDAIPQPQTGTTQQYVGAPKQSQGGLSQGVGAQNQTADLTSQLLGME